MQSPALIGRAAELETLARGLDETRGGSGQTYLLAGEAGIGKSRLVKETMRLATGRDFLVLEGRCFEQDRALPYAPLNDLLRQFAATRSAPEVKEWFEPHAADLAVLLPRLAAPIPIPAPAPDLSPERARRKLFDALLDLLARFAASMPTLIVIEDLHWADENTLEFLLYLSRRIAVQRICLGLTYRADELSPALAHLVAVLDRERRAQEILLTRLSRAQVEEMIRAIFDQAKPLRADFLETIFDLTEGNPFFVEEVLKSLVSAGEIYFARGRWERKPIAELNIPRTVQDAVQTRMQTLDAATRELLTYAAVGGRRINFEVMLHVTESTETELLGNVKHLLAAQLFVQDTEHELAFRHALTHQAVYATLLRRERRAYHREIANALEEIYASERGSHADELAFHFFEAQEWDKARGYAEQAGDRARELFAPRAALEQYTRAIQANERLGAVPPTGLYRARAQCYELVGEFDAARGEYERALEIARTQADGAAEAQSYFDLGFLWMGHNYARAAEYLQMALAAARRTGDPRAIAASLNRVGNWQLMSEQPREGLAAHREALALYQTLNDRAGMAATFDLLGVGSLIACDALQSAENYTRAVELFRELNDKAGLMSALAVYATRGAAYNFDLLVCPPTPAELARAELDEALRLARELNWRSAEAMVLCYIALGGGPRGEFRRAWDAGQRALEIATDIEHGVWAATAQWALGLICAEALDWEHAAEWYERAGEGARRIGSRFIVDMMEAHRAMAAVAQKDLERAREILAEREISPDDALTLARAALERAEIELQYASGDTRGALRHWKRFVTRLPQIAEGGVVPRLWLLRGQLLLSLGRAREAEKVLRAGLNTAMQLGVLPQVWRLQLELGKALVSLRRRAAAEQQFDAARAVIAQLAADSPEELGQLLASRALAAIPSRPTPTPRQAAKRASGGLSAREREIAALIARGKSNRALARELVLSERTIEKHVENIMRKLRVDTRAQIAVWVVERGDKVVKG